MRLRGALAAAGMLLLFATAAAGAGAPACEHNGCNTPHWRCWSSGNYPFAGGTGTGVSQAAASQAALKMCHDAKASHCVLFQCKHL